MKKITTLAMLLFFAAAVLAQQHIFGQLWKESDLFKKSQTQRAAGWLLSVAGTVGLFATFHADFQQMETNAVISIFSGGTAEQEPTKSYAVPYAISGAAIATGVYLLVRSSMNRHKAKATSVFIDMERSRILSGNAFVCQSFPVVGLRVRL